MQNVPDQENRENKGATSEDAFNRLCDDLLGDLKGDETLRISLRAEHSRFIRFNSARVRQDGTVREGTLNLEMTSRGRGGKASLDFTGMVSRDLPRAREEISDLRHALRELPEDPNLVLPSAGEDSREVQQGRLLEDSRAAAEILEPLYGRADQDAADLTGIFASGEIMAAAANSEGRRHWFSTETFSLDYSLSTPEERMVKGVFAGREWDSNAYRAGIEKDLEKLAVLKRKAHRPTPGRYRVYMEPAAAADIVAMFSWGALSEGALRRGSGALIKMREGGKKLSPLFSLSEDFRVGGVPRFNSSGETAPEHLPLIAGGELVNTLVSSRTGMEYGIPSNFASRGEGPRSPIMLPGTLTSDAAVRTLRDGLYLSNLHYLNWSDRMSARITGMTRYACFLVEKGEITAPIENMRFDDSLYDFLGPALEAVGDQAVWNPDVETYGGRAPGGIHAPGLIVDGFKLTL